LTSVTIFGDGNMGSAIAGVLTAGGATVDHITTANNGAGTVSGDLVILAVPYPALDSIVGTYGDQLAGKTVVDITNPVNFETFDSLTVPADSSAAAELAAALPSSKVLKAFNTTFAGTLATKTVGPNPTTVLIAGDDADAKALLAAAVSAGGVEALDAGSLRRARELEALGFLQMTLAAGEKVGWTGGFGVVR
jgi:8-hydroxy-5-deazaflavin:NADPH oxidoreductase